MKELQRFRQFLNENLAGLKAGRFDDSRYETLYVFSPSKIEDITYGEEELDSVDIPSGKYHAILWHNSDLEVYTANSEEELVNELEEDFFDEGAFGDFEGLKAAANDSEPDGDSNHGIALFVDGKLVAGPQGGVEIYEEEEKQTNEASIMGVPLESFADYYTALELATTIGVPVVAFSALLAIMGVKKATSFLKKGKEAVMDWYEQNKK